MIALDGSQGEGGGQILRSSLALSILTKQPFKLTNIRANRPKPGLAAQHLASVRAAATICGGTYKGGSLGSRELYFEPGTVKSGNYTIAIGTAGATALVLHTVYLPLLLRGEGVSTLTITGGTHVLAAPCFHYLQTTWAGFLAKLGASVEVELVRPGFYPRGGGEIRATIAPCATLKPLHLTACPELTTAGGFSAGADLPDDVARKQARRMGERLKRVDVESHLPLETWANGPGSVAAIVFRQLTPAPLFAALGARGRPAEAVADEAADAAIAFRETKSPVDPHAADQLVLPLAFAAGASTFRTSEVTRHLLTNVGTVRAFVGREIECDGVEGLPGTVRVGV